MAEVQPPFPANGRGPTYGDGRIYAYGRTDHLRRRCQDRPHRRIVRQQGAAGRGRRSAAGQVSGQGRQPGTRLPARPPTTTARCTSAWRSRNAHIPGGLVVAGRRQNRRHQVGVQYHPAGAGRRRVGDRERHVAGRPACRRRHVDAARHRSRARPAVLNAGNPSPDYDGSARKGIISSPTRSSRCNLQTGKLAWYYQTIHHEVWDFDLVTGPLLFDVNVVGGRSRAWRQPARTATCTSWHRDTGQPINPMVEMAVPTQTDVPGEEIWPTQPFPYTAKGVPMQPFCETLPDHRRP